MPILIHEFPAPHAKPCGSVADHDGFTARADAVTCPECRARQQDESVCTSRSSHGWRCGGERGHGGLHHAEAHGRAYAWTDETSPELCIDLHGPR